MCSLGTATSPGTATFFIPKTLKIFEKNQISVSTLKGIYKSVVTSAAFWAQIAANFNGKKSHPLNFSS